jgi:hypothetical protein
VANELQVTYTSGAGPHLYATIRRLSDLKPWNGTAFEAWNDANLALYGPDLTDMGGDVWAADVPATLPAGDYRVTYYERAGGTRATTDLPLKTRMLSLPGGGAVITPGAHYGSEAGMRKMIKLSYDLFGDVDNDGTLDSDVTEDVLARSDAYIKRFIRANGVTPPEPETLGAIDANDAESLRDIGDHMGVWFIAQDRGLLETAARQSSSANAIAGGVGGYKTYADEELAKLVTILQASDAVPDVRGSGAIQTSVAAPKLYPGVPVVAPAYTLPAPTGPWSY